jgi:hypothetical protein
MMTATTQPTLPPSAGGQRGPVDARTLPLVAASLAADAGGGLARVVLEQRFHNAHTEPLSVVYSLPLPVDAAVSGFAFRIGDLFTQELGNLPPGVDVVAGSTPKG